MFHLSSEDEDDSSSSSSSSLDQENKKKEKREKRTPARAGIVNEETVERAREQEVRACIYVFVSLSLSREKF